MHVPIRWYCLSAVISALATGIHVFLRPFREEDADGRAMTLREVVQYEWNAERHQRIPVWNTEISTSNCVGSSPVVLFIVCREVE